MTNLSGGKTGWKEKVAHEMISYVHYGFSLIEALVLAKVIMLGDILKLGRGLEANL